MYDDAETARFDAFIQSTDQHARDWIAFAEFHSTEREFSEMNVWSARCCFVSCRFVRFRTFSVVPLRLPAVPAVCSGRLVPAVS